MGLELCPLGPGHLNPEMQQEVPGPTVSPAGTGSVTSQRSVPPPGDGIGAAGELVPPWCLQRPLTAGLPGPALPCRGQRLPTVHMGLCHLAAEWWSPFLSSPQRPGACPPCLAQSPGKASSPRPSAPCHPALRASLGPLQSPALVSACSWHQLSEPKRQISCSVFPTATGPASVVGRGGRMSRTERAEEGGFTMSRQGDPGGDATPPVEGRV